MMFHPNLVKTHLPALLTSTVLLAACNAPATSAEPERSAAAADLQHPFSIVQDDDSDSVLTIERGGAEVWRIESFVVSAGPIADLTGDGRANVLIHEAATVSDRALHLLDLPAEGEVSVLWTLSGHASDFHRQEALVYELIAAGEPVATPPYLAPDDGPGAQDAAELAVEEGYGGAASGVGGDYAFMLTPPDNRLSVTRDGSQVWRSDHTVIAYQPALMPGTPRQEVVLVHEAVSRSARKLHLLSLEGMQARPLWHTEGGAAEMIARYDQIAAALAAGQLDLQALQAGTSEGPAASSEAGESVAQDSAPSAFIVETFEDPREGVAVLRDGEEIWRFESWMASIKRQGDLTGNGVGNLLIFYARTRSVRGYVLAELADHGVEVIWDVSGVALDFEEIEEDILSRLDQGLSLETPPTRTHPDAAALLAGIESAGEPASDGAPADSDLQARIAAMGYALLAGDEADARDIAFAVTRHGEIVWSVRAMMLGHHALRPSSNPDAVELVVEVRETRRYGTDYVLELAADGLTVISETDGEVSGFQPPSERKPWPE